MEYPMQDFDIDEETDFLLGGSVNHGNDMDNTYFNTSNRRSQRRNTLGNILCR